MNGSAQQDKSYVQGQRDREKPYLEEKGLGFLGWKSKWKWKREAVWERSREGWVDESTGKTKKQEKKKRITKKKVPCLCGSLSSNMSVYVQ